MSANTEWCVSMEHCAYTIGEDNAADALDRWTGGTAREARDHFDAADDNAVTTAHEAGFFGPDATIGFWEWLEANAPRDVYAMAAGD